MKVLRIGMGCIMFVCGLGAAPFARANCIDDAAAYQHVNPLILRAIAWQESHNRADAMHVNANGSIDYGLMQINTIHLPALARYGIGRDALMSPCKNVYIAAWQLRRQVIRYGNTWAAVGAYHSATPALRDEYARQIAGVLRRWQVLPEDRSGARIAQRPPVYAGNGPPSEWDAPVTTIQVHTHNQLIRWLGKNVYGRTVGYDEVVWCWWEQVRDGACARSGISRNAPVFYV